MNIIKKKKFRKHFVKGLILFIALACAGAVAYGLWNAGVFLPRWIVWENSALQDASGEYEIDLAGKRVRVRYGDELIWSTEQDIKVQKALAADIDRDGQDELVLLCWRKGHYGDVRPIWVEEDSEEWVQHIFVYELTQEKVHAKWMSSYIGRDILDISTKETEGAGSFLCLTDTGKEVSTWVWDSWGFTKIEN